MSLLGGARNHGNLEIGEYAAHNLIEVDSDARTACYTVLSILTCMLQLGSGIKFHMKEK